MEIPTDISNNLKMYKNFDEAAESILRMMSEFIGMNTLFIAKNDKQTNEIVKVHNRNEPLLKEGEKTPFHETFCNLSVEKGREVLQIPDLTKNDMTVAMNVTKNLGSGSFIGIPIYYENGENYGTICGLDTEVFEFTQKHNDLFLTMASVLSYVLELDKATQQIQSLSAPFVPITKGIAVLPIIGVINEQIAENIIFLALTKSQQLSLEYLIIDLSGISKIDNFVIASLMRIVNLLELIGVTPMLTGVNPNVASKAVEVNAHADLQGIMIEANLERALNKIGFILEKKQLSNQ